MKVLKRGFFILIVGIVGMIVIVVISDILVHDYRNLIRSCNDDIDSLCANARDNGRMVACLRSHASEVSASCQQAIMETFGE